MDDTAATIHSIGHRNFIGGQDQFWDQIGDLQIRYLCERGLRPTDIFCDVACGSLRGGSRFIRYLEPDHYLGIDKHIELIIYGVAVELGIEAFRLHRPHFVVSDRFEFEKFGMAPTFAIAQSLFTHLTMDDIELCLRRLSQTASPGCRLFASFIETTEPTLNNPTTSHSNYPFAYTRGQMERAGVASGWSPNYIGRWEDHPRGVHLIEYVKS